MREPAARAFDCRHYRSCLDSAAAADACLSCPCIRYERDPNAARWSDVEACKHLIMAALLPDAWAVFTRLRGLDDRREKWQALREAWPALGLLRRDISRAGRR